MGSVLDFFSGEPTCMMRLGVMAQKLLLWAAMTEHAARNRPERSGVVLSRRGCRVVPVCQCVPGSRLLYRHAAVLNIPACAMPLFYGFGEVAFKCSMVLQREALEAFGFRC
jgi:hypothetical protein